MTGDVEKWLKALPEKSIEEELEQLRGKAEAINRRIEVREQALAMKRSFGSEEPPPVEAHRPNRVSPMNPPFRGREAIRRVIASEPNRQTWTIPEMLDAILKRGWTANTHAVQVNLSRMYRDGELEKGGTGVYVVPNKQDNLLASNAEAQE